MGGDKWHETVRWREEPKVTPMCSWGTREMVVLSSDPWEKGWGRAET